MKKKFIFLTSLLLLGALYLLAQDSWAPKASFPGTNRYAAVSLAIGEKGYTGLGSSDAGYMDDFWEFDPVANTWTQKANFPGGARNSAIGFCFGDKGYVGFGANTPGDVDWIWYKDIWQYDPVANTWTRKNDFGGHERYFPVSFVIGNKVYVGTGEYRTNRWVDAEYYNDFWEYDPALDSWTRKADVPELGRVGATGLSIGNKGYIGLGFYYYDTRMNDWWEYDPGTDKWTRKAYFAGVPRGFSSGMVLHNKAYVGIGANGGPCKDMWEYNPLTDAWIQKTDFPGEGRYQAVAFTIGEKGYMGLGTYNVNFSDFYEYSPDWVTLTCAPDVTIYSDRGCGGSVTGIVPSFTPATANPLVTWVNLWRGSILRQGTGLEELQHPSFPVGVNTMIYKLPEYGNQTCSMKVTVLDSVFPTIIPPPEQRFCYSPTNRYSIPYLVFSDNCDIIWDISQGAFIGYSITGATNRSGLWPDASGIFNPGTSIIHWTVTDGSHHTVTGETKVVVDPLLQANIPNSYSVLFGNPNTIYLGYNPGGILLAAMPSGGTRFGNNTYKYQWSNGATGRIVLVNPSTVGNHTYSVIVTDSLGCQVTVEKVITVTDVRCGPQGNKVLLCVPTKFGYREDCVKKQDVLLYLFLGAKLGNCTPALNAAPLGSMMENKADNTEKSIRLYPNPNSGSFQLLINNFSPGKYEVTIMDAKGKVILQQVQEISQNRQIVNFQIGVPAKGIYLVRVSGNEGVLTQKLMIQ